MANERDDEQFNQTEGRSDQQPAGQQNQQQPTGQQGQQDATGEQGQGSDGTGGQPIGGNDSNTGTGTPLSQGADFGGQSGTGQTQPSDANGETLTSDQQSETSSQSSQSGSQGEGFIGSQGSGSDDYLRDENPSGADATDGSDFAKQGRGSLDEDDESDGDSAGGSL